MDSYKLYHKHQLLVVLSSVVVHSINFLNQPPYHKYK